MGTRRLTVVPRSAIGPSTNGSRGRAAGQLAQCGFSDARPALCSSLGCRMSASGAMRTTSEDPQRGVIFAREAFVI